MGQIGAREIVLLLIIVLVVFGSKRLPDIARSLGKSMRILKSETAAMKAESRADTAEPSTAGAPTQPLEGKTIQAAPGDVSSARPVVEEPKAASQA